MSSAASSLAHRFKRPHLRCVGESPSAARTLAIETSDKRRKCGRLRKGHDRFERQRSTMGIVAISDSADGMAEDLDRRLGNVLVVVRRASLAEVLEHPRFVFVRLDICFGPDAGVVAKFPKSSVRARAAAKENGIVRAGILRHNAFNVSVHDSIHWPVEGLARLHPTIEEPSPGRLLFDFPIWRFRPHEIWRQRIGSCPVQISTRSPCQCRS